MAYQESFEEKVERELRQVERKDWIYCNPARGLPFLIDVNSKERLDLSRVFDDDWQKHGDRLASWLDGGKWLFSGVRNHVYYFLQPESGEVIKRKSGLAEPISVEKDLTIQRPHGGRIDIYRGGELLHLSPWQELYEKSHSPPPQQDFGRFRKPTFIVGTRTRSPQASKIGAYSVEDNSVKWIFSRPKAVYNWWYAGRDDYGSDMIFCCTAAPICEKAEKDTAYLLSITGDGPKLAVSCEHFHYTRSVSPGGKYLVDRYGSHPAHIVSLPSGNIVHAMSSIGSSWSPEGDRIAYVDPGRNMISVLGVQEDGFFTRVADLAEIDVKIHGVWNPISWRPKP